MQINIWNKTTEVVSLRSVIRFLPTLEYKEIRLYEHTMLNVLTPSVYRKVPNDLTDTLLRLYRAYLSSQIPQSTPLSIHIPL